MQRFRYLGLLAGCWTFVVMPALCVGGVLMHPCDCPHTGDLDHQDKEGCGHESECATDPCGDVVTRPDDQPGTDSSFHSDVIVTVSPTLLLDPAIMAAVIWSSPPCCVVGATVDAALATTKLLI
ncbi:MAG: hypothetical protein AABZ47_09920 [Planctomycetota bacterium]